MSERLTLCPWCKSKKVTTQKVHNPDTQEMNADARLGCEECGHQWEGKVTSRHTEWMRDRGMWI